MSGNPYKNTPAMTAIAISAAAALYGKSHIASDVLPIVPVFDEDFKYTEYNEADGFSAPETRVSDRGELGLMQFGGVEKTASVYDHGLRDIIPNKYRGQNSRHGKQDPVNRSVMLLTTCVLNRREVRVAAFAQNPDNFGNIEDFGGSKLTAAGTDAVALIEGLLEAGLIRANTLNISSKGWSALRSNKAVVKAVQGNSGDSGLASKEQVQRLFSLQKINVGDMVTNTAKPGRPTSIAKIWGNAMSLTYQGPIQDVQGGLTWGITPQMGGWITGERDVPGMGLEGGTEVKAGHKLSELLIAKSAGTLIQNIY